MLYYLADHDGPYNVSLVMFYIWINKSSILLSLLSSYHDGLYCPPYCLVMAVLLYSSCPDSTTKPTHDCIITTCPIITITFHSPRHDGQLYTCVTPRLYYSIYPNIMDPLYLSNHDGHILFVRHNWFIAFA